MSFLKINQKSIAELIIIFLFLPTLLFGGVKEGEVVEHVLSNGLKVLTVENHNSPIIYSQITYKVGSRNEHFGITGISHLVEHMMFKGTSTYPGQVLKNLIKKSGGIYNAFTTNDLTAYYEQVPKNKIDVVLAIEADRMHNSKFDPKEFQHEREVVIEERHMRTDDSPKGMFAEEFNAIAFKSHPYHNPTVGWISDIQAITRDQAYQYYKTYYVPNNATLVLVGDFDTAHIMKLVQKYYGVIPKGKPVPPVISVEEPQNARRTLTYKRADLKMPVLQMSFHTPTFGDPDCAPLTIAAKILGGGRFPRLKKVLTQEKNWARSVRVFFQKGKDPQLFSFIVELYPKYQSKLDSVEAIIWDEIRKMQTEPITDFEFQKIKNNLRADELVKDEKVSAIGGKLSRYETLLTWKYRDEWPKELKAVTKADIQRVMNTYFAPEKVTVGYLLPDTSRAKRRELAHKKHHKKLKSDVPEGHGRVRPPAVMNNEAISLSDVIRPRPVANRIHTFILKNGIRVYAIEDHTVPAFRLHGIIDTGNMPEEAKLHGIVNFFGKMMNRGTQKHTFEQLSQMKSFIPISWQIQAHNGAILFNGFSLREDVDSLFTIGKEMLFEPSFPKDQVDRVRKSSIALLKSAEKGTGWKTSVFLFSNVYKNHPYGWMAGGTPESLQKITQKDLFAIHKKYVRPEQTRLIVLSDFSAKELKKFLNKTFGHWKNKTPFTYHKFPQVPPTRGKIVKAFPIPGKKQVDVKLGFRWVAKTDSNLDALDVLNGVLGGSTLTSRLGVTIRDKMGLTYGITTKTRTRKMGGIWFLAAKTEPRHVRRLIRESLKIINQVRENGITETELKKAQSFDLRILPMVVETPGDILNLVTDMVKYGQPLTYFDTYYDRIMRLNVSTINQLAKKYLNTENYVLTVAGDIPATILDEFK